MLAGCADALCTLPSPSQLWDSGFISVPFNFKINELPNKIKLLQAGQRLSDSSSASSNGASASGQPSLVARAAPGGAASPGRAAGGCGSGFAGYTLSGGSRALGGALGRAAGTGSAGQLRRGAGPGAPALRRGVASARSALASLPRGGVAAAGGPQQSPALRRL